MTSANLIAWLKQPGEHVKAGEPIAEIETDKTTVELESPADGVLDEICIAAGTQEIPVGTVIALLSDYGCSDDMSIPEDDKEIPPTSTEIRLPELAESMTSANLIIWLKQPGEHVKAGEPIAEIETDKTTVELESPADGVLDEICIAAGTQEIPVGSLLATILDSSAEGSVTFDSSSSEPTEPSTTTSPSKTKASKEQDLPTTAIETQMSSVDVQATPLAQRMASLTGIDLGEIFGSGDEGRVTKDDVEKRLGEPPRSLEVPDLSSDISRIPLATPSLPDVAHTDKSLTSIRRVTAERMTMAKKTIPHFYLEIKCVVDRLLVLRNDKNTQSDLDKLTVNDFVVRATALALTKVPQANSAWTGNAVRVFDTVNISVAVTTESGLVTPVIRSADTKDIRMIAKELRDLTAKARDGNLQLADYSGGTCTISNLGMYGISSLYAILNPPQSCILGIGAIEPKALVSDGVVNVGSIMTITLSADHRAIDGVTGAELLKALKNYIENPHQLFE